MKLDEALQHRWAGKDIKRKKWTGTLDSITKNLEAGYLAYNLFNEDIDADDWEVVPKYVGLDEAWKALNAGKEIEAEDRPYDGALYRRKFRLRDSTLILEVQSKHDNFWRHYGSYIPLHWLDADNFEILED